MSARRARAARHTADDDQARAASRDSSRILSAMAAHEQTSIKYGHPDVWPAALVGDVLTGLDSGATRTCRHLRSPRPAISLAWQPGEVTCMSCAMPALESIKGTPEDNRCDVCGIPSSTTSSCAIRVGALIVVWGACRGCRAGQREAVAA